MKRHLVAKSVLLAGVASIASTVLYYCFVNNKPQDVATCHVKSAQNAVRVARERRLPTLSQACNAVFEPSNHSCSRYMTNKINVAAGFGHKFSEFLFGLWTAKKHRLSYVYEPFGSSGLHKDDYSAFDSMLGLSEAFATLGGASKHAIDSLMKQNRLVSASIFDKDIQTACDRVVLSGGFSYCRSSASNNCFVAPENEFLFERTKNCLRSSVKLFGHVFEKCIFTPLNSASDPTTPMPVNIVWHIRLGDMELHMVGDPFYERVMIALRAITMGYRPRLIFVGASEGIPRDYMDFVSNLAVETWQGTNVSLDIQSPAYDFTDSMVAMMQADILIGSGSSLPAIASLLSGTPMFFNHPMKHGFNYGAEMTADNIDLAANGTVLDSVRRLKIAMHAHMHMNATGPCRSHHQHPIQQR